MKRLFWIFTASCLAAVVPWSVAGQEETIVAESVVASDGATVQDVMSWQEMRDAEQRAPTWRQQRIKEREKRHKMDGVENNLFFTFGIVFSGHNQVLGRFKVEYSRPIKDNFYWGVAFGTNMHISQMLYRDYTSFPGGRYTRDALDQDIYKLDGMIYYRLPVIASRLYFRLGLGVGLGFHNIHQFEDDTKPGLRVIPYLNLEAAWILRLSKNLEVKFSPLFYPIIPPDFSISPIKIHGSVTKYPWMLNIGASLSFGVRF